MPGRIGLVSEHGRVHEIQREGCRHGFSLSETERRRNSKVAGNAKIISEWCRVMPPFLGWLNRSQKVFKPHVVVSRKYGL